MIDKPAFQAPTPCPDTSASASLGAVLAIQTGLSAAFPLGLPLAALAGAAISVLLVLTLAGPRGGTLALILAGIAISALAGAGTSLVLNLSPNPFAANEIVFWMMGSLADRSMLHVWIASPLMLLGFALLWPTRRALQALTLGEDAAASASSRMPGLSGLWWRPVIFGSSCRIKEGATSSARSVP